jgi:uncharacterized protein
MNSQKDPFISALEENDVVKVRHFLETGRSVTERYLIRRTPLHVAAMAGATTCVSLLLEQGAEIEAVDDIGCTALVAAVEAKQLETVALLLKAGARSSYTYTPENTPGSRDQARLTHQNIMEHTRQAHPEFFELLEDPEFGMTREELDQEMAELFMKVTTDPREIHAVNHCGDFQILRLLVEQHGATCNDIDTLGDWPLKTFAGLGDVEAVTWLLARGANPDLTDTGATALHDAVAGDHLECARSLLQAGANPNQPDVDGCVPMWRLQSDAMLDLLLSFGADPTIGDQCDFKPSHWVEKPELKARLQGLESAAKKRKQRKK